MTATLFPCCDDKTRLSRVVLPDPRKPVIMVTGTVAILPDGGIFLTKMQHDWGQDHAAAGLFGSVRLS
jgi:hypothetical protein